MPGKENRTSSTKESGLEKGSRFFRNINALGAVALGGAAIIAPPLAVPLSALAGINAVQAGGFEALRRHAKKKRIRRDGQNKAGRKTP